MRKISYLFLIILVLSSLSALAQDLTDQERIQVSNPGVYTDWPFAAVNGKGEIGLFFMWFGGSGAPDGIAFRKLDKKGLPSGPQNFAYKTNPSETRGFELLDVVYNNNSYFVLVYNGVQESMLLFRFNESGKFISKARHKLGERERLQSYFINLAVFGDNIYAALSTSEGFYISGDRDPKGSRKTENYLLKASIHKADKFEIIELAKPTNKFLFNYGISVDADHLVILTGELWLASDFEIINPGIITYDPVSGKVSDAKPLDCHKEINFLFFSPHLTKPVYNGEGHVIFYSTAIENSYYHSFVFNSAGETLYGPVNLNEQGNWHLAYDSDLIGTFAFFGNLDFEKEAILAMMIGRKGKHSKNIYYDEDRHPGFAVGSLGQVFTGNNLVFYYLGRDYNYRSILVYTKSTPTPKPIRDGISFFQAGSKSFADGSRHLIWSTVGSESVTIKHDGKEYINMPPQYSFQLKDVNINKPVELTFTSAAGKTYSRKLNLK